MKNHIIIEPNSFFPEGAVGVWCVGHILRTKSPGDYKEEWKTWKMDNLPMFPQQLELEADPSKKGQLAIIRKFLHDKSISQIYHFGDAGREGQLLVDEVLLHLNNKKPVRRVWATSLTKSATLKALDEAKDNKAYSNLYSAAHTRQMTDWIIGMNTSRALSILLSEKYNLDERFQLGRCKTPLVGIVYDREVAIETFQPIPYWDIEVEFGNESNSMVGHWFKENEDHVWDQSSADALMEFCKGKAGLIQSIVKERKEILPPQFFNLTELQSEANRRYKYSPSKTLEIAQALYEKGVISYPRADPRVVSNEEAILFPLILDVISELPQYHHLIPPPIADISTDKRYVNNELVNDHYAIIPTEEVVPLESLPEEQRCIYKMILDSFIAAHYKPAVVENTEIITVVDDHFSFKTKGHEMILPGWKIVLDIHDTENQRDKRGIPVVREGEILNCKGIEIREGKTTPPKRFTEGQLVKIMERSAAYVRPEDRKGYTFSEMALGTVATRANIIQEIIKNGYVTVKKNLVQLTPKGRLLIDAIGKNNWLASPVTTGKMENSLNSIVNGQLSTDKFTKATQKLITSFIKDIAGISQHWNFEYLTSQMSERTSIGACLICGSPVINKGSFYGCSAHKTSSCSFTISKEKGSKIIPTEEIKSLLTKGTTGLIPGFKGRNGKYFNAHLIWNPKENKVEYEFPK